MICKGVSKLEFWISGFWGLLRVYKGFRVEGFRVEGFSVEGFRV